MDWPTLLCGAILGLAPGAILLAVALAVGRAVVRWWEQAEIPGPLAGRGPDAQAAGWPDDGSDTLEPLGDGRVQITVLEDDPGRRTGLLTVRGKDHDLTAAEFRRLARSADLAAERLEARPAAGDDEWDTGGRRG